MDFVENFPEASGALALPSWLCSDPLQGWRQIVASIIFDKRDLDTFPANMSILHGPHQLYRCRRLADHGFAIRKEIPATQGATPAGRFRHQPKIFTYPHSRRIAGYLNWGKDPLAPHSKQSGQQAQISSSSICARLVL